MVEIIGAKGEIKNIDQFLKKLDRFAKKNDILIQVFNANLIFGKKHIFSAFEHAKRSFERKENTTNSLEMESLLYASGERQLKLAIPKMGIKNNNKEIALLLINKSDDKKIDEKTIEDLLIKQGIKRNDEVLEGSKVTLEIFGISKNEIESVNKSKYGDLILEKVAMVDIKK